MLLKVIRYALIRLTPIWALLSIVVVAQAQFPEFRFGKLDISQGLSNNEITAIVQDNDGFMWFGTQNGLCRYDGNSFRIFSHKPNDPFSLPHNSISSLNIDPEGIIWIGMRSGYTLYDPVMETFSRDLQSHFQKKKLPSIDIKRVFQCQADFFFIVDQDEFLYWYNPIDFGLKVVQSSVLENLRKDSIQISTVGVDSRNRLWILYANGILSLTDPAIGADIFSTDILQQAIGPQPNQFELFIDTDDEVWVYVKNEAKGIYRYNVKSHTITHYHARSEKFTLGNNTVEAVSQDSNGLIWIGTDHGGINIIDKKNESTVNLITDTHNRFSISQNSIKRLYVGNDNTMWVGTHKNGLNYYNEQAIRFRLFQNKPNDLTSLPYNDINAFAEDKSGNLWIGTNGGGLIFFDQSRNEYTRYQSQFGHAHSISSDVIVCLFIDSRDELWIGTYYGGLNRYAGNGHFEHFRHNPHDPHSIPDDRIWAISENSDGHILIGTMLHGLVIYDREQNTFHKWEDVQAAPIFSTHVSAIIADQLGNTWVGTADGVSVLDPGAQTSLHYFHDQNNPYSISNDLVNALYADSRGLIWVGTSNGLNLFSHADKKFLRFGIEDGLPDNMIFAITEDNDGFIWISTSNGIGRLEIHQTNKDEAVEYTLSCIKYEENDGLQGNMFNPRAALKTQQGELLFAGPNGFNMFVPGDITINDKPDVIKFTKLQVFGQDVLPGQKEFGRKILEQSITKTTSLVLKHSEKSFTIDFAALNYTHPGKNQFAYKLEGFSDQWIYLNQHDPASITFTNLNPGHYTLQVIASNSDGIWDDKGSTLEIRIMPPFWKSKYAIWLYAVILIAVMFIARKLINLKKRLNSSLEKQKREQDFDDIFQATGQSKISSLDTDTRQDQANESEQPTELRAAENRTWNTVIDDKTGKAPIASLDEKFISKAVDIVEMNMSNADFTVEELSKAMNISRVYLYKKLIAITGIGPSDFIRIIRMKQAAELLKKSQLSIAEICYEVGYNNPKYFSRHFKKEYKTTPSNFKKRFK